MSHPTVVDARGLRFSAALTSLVLAAALVVPPIWTIALLIAQTAIFFVGAVIGLQYSPYSWLFRTFVVQHLSSPPVVEDSRPPKFAQRVGLGFTVAALLAAAAGLWTLSFVAIAAALVAAFLNAATGFCLGCELYLATRRARLAFATLT